MNTVISLNCTPTVRNWSRLLLAVLLSFFLSRADAQCVTGTLAGTLFTPACTGSPETVNSTAFAGTYSEVNLVGGSAYTFASSVGTDLITIANGGGIALTFGTGSVTYIAFSSNIYRFYVHSNAACGTQAASRTRTLRCMLNDMVCNAQPITCGSTTAGSTVSMTSTGTEEGTSTCGVAQSQPGVWYSIVGEGGRTYTASLCGSISFDSRVSVYSGTCSALTCIGGNDNFGPACNGNPASFEWAASAGVTYYIKVHGTTATGAFSLALNCTPVNDQVCFATPVACGSNTSGTTIGATGTGTGEGGNVCGFGQSSNPAVWYSVAGETGNNITASLCPSSTWNSRIGIYAGPCDALACIGGNDDEAACPGTNAAGYTWAGVTGTTYYIKVYSTVAASPFTLSVNCAPPPPACAGSYTAPANGSSTCGPNSTATLSWPAVANATGYDVYFDNATGTTLVGSNQSALTYTTGTLSPATYSWRIVPRNAGGTPSGCPTWTFSRFASPTTATVGGPQSICASGTTASLGGTPVVPVGTGLWTVVSGGTGTFGDASKGSSNFTHTGGIGPITLRWSITNGPCVSSADVVITIIVPTGTPATVGGPQSICALGTTSGLGGNTPIVGTGAWTLGGSVTGTFSNTSLPNATFTRTGGSDPTFAAFWTITNGPCPSTAVVQITVVANPTPADPGGPQSVCTGTSTQPLGSNNVVSGTPSWTILSGGTGNFFPSANDPHPTFQHTGGAGPIVLRNTVSTGGTCTSSANVTITITAPLTWYADLDGDGAGDPNNSVVTCTPLSYHVTTHNDLCPLDPLKINPGVCGCGNPDADNDGDGVLNCLDGCPSDPNKVTSGSCGCGIADVDTDGDGTANCIDGCPNDGNKVAPGVCGCGSSDADTDNDAVANCVDGCPFDGSKVAPGTCGCGDLEPGASCNDGIAWTTNDVIGANCACGGTATNTVVAAAIFLEGPFNSNTNLMNDVLRTLPSFPLTEPYTALGYAHIGGGGESIMPAVLLTSGPHAIVDWVLVELRSQMDPSIILNTRSALLQRDGEVVDVNGTSPVAFSIAPGAYYVAIRHRNHIGCMTAHSITLSASPFSVDFTALGYAVYGTDARKTSTGAVPVQLLWAGDVNFNGQLKYAGSNNDRDPILVSVGSTTPNNATSGYVGADVNMDGQVKYTGTSNDRDPILVNVGSATPNNIRVQQLP